jgi:hypothetical protein
VLDQVPSAIFRTIIARSLPAGSFRKRVVLQRITWSAMSTIFWSWVLKMNVVPSSPLSVSSVR